MSATSQSAIAQQRGELVNKVESEVQQRIDTDTVLFRYFRVVLQDLPFNGQPALIEDTHRQAIERLVDKQLNPTYRVRVTKIIGYASTIGAEQANLDLSLQRAEAVHQYLMETLAQQGVASEDFLANSFSIEAQGELNLPSQDIEEQDNPLNRRVEILYNLMITLPSPNEAAGPSSTMWKIDFGPAGSGFLLSAGMGTLSMLPDGQNGLNAPISKTFNFEQLGVSVGLFSVLRKLKFVEKFPLLKRLLKGLDSGKAGNYPKTEALLNNIGFSVDLVSTGGEFSTGEALTFEELRSFNYATVSAGLSIMGKGEGALLMLHSGRFFAYTVILGFGQNIAVPDAELQFIPAGFVQLDLPAEDE